MKANELRIGNYLQDQNGNILLVIHISTESIQTTVLDRIKYPLPNGWQMEPIPLTPEILEKCGFENDYKNSGSKWHKKQYFTDCKEAAEVMIINVNPENGRVAIYDEESYESPAMTGKSILYLHQLQNLYFALTGEELEVKL